MATEVEDDSARRNDDSGLDKRLDNTQSIQRMDRFSCCSCIDIDDNINIVSHPWHYDQWYYSDGIVFERQSSPRPRRRYIKRQWLYPLYRPSNSTLSAYRILLVIVALACLLIPTTEATQAENPTVTNPVASSSIATAPISPQNVSFTMPRSPTNKKKKKRPKKKSVAGHAGTVLQSGSQAAFLRRVQGEWKDAVEMGIAYDWVQQKPIHSKTESKKKLKGLVDADAGESPQHPTANITSIDIQSNQRQETQQDRKYMCLGPLGKNLFMWVFSFAGMEGSNFEGGIYSGLLILPANYPMSPPRVQVWTPSGRFIPRADICLSASSFHPETWNPAAYSFRTIIESLRLHMLTHAVEIGGMNGKPADQRDLATKSRSWHCELGEKLPVVIDHARLIQEGFAAANDNTAEADLDGQAGTQADSAVVPLHVEVESLLDQYFEGDSGQMQTKQKNKVKNKRKSKKKKKKKNVMELRDEGPGLVTKVVRDLLSNGTLRLVLILACVYVFVLGGFY
jgi:ubiquitin-protein ligase